MNDAYQELLGVTADYRALTGTGKTTGSWAGQLQPTVTKALVPCSLIGKIQLYMLLPLATQILVVISNTCPICVDLDVGAHPRGLSGEIDVMAKPSWCQS